MHTLHIYSTLLLFFLRLSFIYYANGHILSLIHMMLFLLLCRFGISTILMCTKKNILH